MKPFFPFLRHRYIFAGLALVAFVIIMPVSASYYQVAPQISRGATIFIGEQNLNITPALLAGQSASGLPGTANTIGWWASAAVISSMPPIKTIDLANRSLSFAVAPSDFVGYAGTWYLVNPTTGFAAAPLITVADPCLDIRIWDFDQAAINLYGADVTGKSVTKGDLLGFRIDTPMTAVFNGKRSPVRFANGNTEVIIPAGTVLDPGFPTGDGYIDIKVKTDSGNLLTALYNGSPSVGGMAIPITAQNVSVSNWFWGTSPGTTSPSPFIAGPPGLNLPSCGGWATGAIDDIGQNTYPAGTYTVWAESLLNNMKDNYQNGGADYTTKTVSQTYTITLVSDFVRIEANKEAVVRSKPFSVTISGRPNTAYHLWIRGTSQMDGSYNNQPPRIAVNQAGTRVGDPLTGNYSFFYGGPVAADVSPYIFPGETFSRFWANITTTAAGTRTVGFETTNWTKPQLYTIRIEKNLSGTVKGDEVNVSVERGAVTIFAAGGPVYNLYDVVNDVVNLSGTNTGSQTTYLFLTGPNLPLNGAQIMSTDPRSTPVVNNDRSTFWQVSVLGDGRWSWRWNSTGFDLDSGIYTIHAVDAPRDNVPSHLQDVEHATVDVTFLKPMSITVDPPTAYIDPFTNVSVNITRKCTYFPIDQSLELTSELEHPLWTYSIVVNGIENAKSQIEKQTFVISGAELNYNPGDQVTLQVTLNGTYPDGENRVAIFGIRNLDVQGNEIPGTAYSELRPVNGIRLDPFPGYAMNPRDLDTDGRFEDLNGNNRLDFDDVIVLFDNLERLQEHGTVYYFDFNGNMRIDFDDIIRLFDKI